MEIRDAELVEVSDLGQDNYLLHLAGELETPEAGQFCMLSLVKGWPVLLPRPFSYFGFGGGPASFLVKAIGPGTRALAEARPGSHVRVVGPLGRGFPSPEDVGRPGKEPICLAGGVGIAPFLLYAKERQAEGKGPVPLLYGGANEAALVGRESFASGAQDFQLATLDGSLGFRGNVLELYRSMCEAGSLDPDAPVYCCGPDPMMHAIAKDCRERDVPCVVSLETYMACGYGVCNGCSVEVRGEGRFAGKRYAKTCTDGPVFLAEELDW